MAATNHDDRPPADPSGDVLIDVDHVSVTFGGQTVLKDIDIGIDRGQTVAIIGESGCGKTVFMKTLIGLIRPTNGKVAFDGQDLASRDPQTMAAVRRRTGFVFQNAALFDSMTIFDNVAFPIRQSQPDTSPGEVRESVMRHLGEVGLPEEAARKRPAELSGGMRKRVGLARALILRPELVVYDEPTTGLDPIMSDVINELIIETRKRYTVTSIVVTHDMHTARKVSDRVLMFFPRRRLEDTQSQILYDGPPDGLDNCDDRRVRQFVQGQAGDRLREMAAGVY